MRTGRVHWRAWCALVQQSANAPAFSEGARLGGSAARYTGPLMGQFTTERHGWPGTKRRAHSPVLNYIDSST